MLTIALAQIAPVWLCREATLHKVLQKVEEAASAGARLVCFGEALVPGYPFWVERTDGARFRSDVQQTLFAHYAEQAVCLEHGHLDELCALAAKHRIAVYLGVIERPRQRTGHSLYASLVYVNEEGEVKSVHRKLMPTYEERLVWSTGDGHGLRVHRLDEFTVGGLNCWENWMPLARAALYGQGEDLHVAVWPGNLNNTVDITRFMALEGRSYVASVSSLMRSEDIPDSLPEVELLRASIEAMPANGGSCIAKPDGSWLIEPQTGSEQLLLAHLDMACVREQRHNFDAAGHYSRPDVTQLHVHRERQSTVSLSDESPD